MPLVGFEHTIPVFEWAKTAHALHRGGHRDRRSEGTAEPFLTSALDAELSL
jgi:hypothetical protein